eukprot:5731203-Alexandrium_andersonii.AAC.1
MVCTTAPGSACAGSTCWCLAARLALFLAYPAGCQCLIVWSTAREGRGACSNRDPNLGRSPGLVAREWPG